MAFKGKIITNTITGHQYTFIKTSSDTKGELLEMEVIYKAHLKEPPPHYHPYQTEEFTVLSGELTVHMNSTTHVYKAGERFLIPPNQIHSMWNDSDDPATVNWKVVPALNSEQLFETITGLANDGKTNASGIPSLLQAALTLNHFSDTFRMAKPPYMLLKIVFVLLSPIARLAGHHACYKKYID